MSESLIEQIKDDLEQARSQGELRAERIKSIVQSALSQTGAELKAGSKEISPTVRDILSTVIEALDDRTESAQSEVSAAIAGAIKAIETPRRREISQTESEIRRLQAQIDAEETQLQKDVKGILHNIQESNHDQPTSVKSAIQTAIENWQETEEMTLMRKRYAQLKSQLAVVQAYFVDHYSDLDEAEVQKYLEEAKSWYQRAKSEPAFFTEKVEQKWGQFETKLAQLGTAVARKERRDQQLLIDLWRSLAEPP